MKRFIVVRGRISVNVASLDRLRGTFVFFRRSPFRAALIGCNCPVIRWVRAGLERELQAIKIELIPDRFDIIREGIVFAFQRDGRDSSPEVSTGRYVETEGHGCRRSTRSRAANSATVPSEMPI